MFLKNTDVVSRLASERNIARVLVTDIVKEARGLIVSPVITKHFGEKHIVPALKPIIAVVSQADGIAKTAERFDVGERTVSRTKEDFLEQELAPVRSLAIDRLSAAITGITPEKLQDVGPLNLSNIARNLSTVIGNTKKKDSEDGGTKFQFNIFAPGATKLKEYEILDV